MVLTFFSMVATGTWLRKCLCRCLLTFPYSLQSTYIRNSVLHGLRETKPEAAKLVSASFVYEHPTIERMATFLSRAVTDPQSALGVGPRARGQELQALVDKYTETFPARPAVNVFGRLWPAGDTYLLTGTTGGLGSNMLAQLLASPTVMRVYAFNRPSRSVTSEARQRSAFEKRGLDTSLLSSKKVIYVEGDLNAPTFALNDGLYGEVRVISYTILHQVFIRHGYIDPRIGHAYYPQWYDWHLFYSLGDCTEYIDSLEN